MATATFGNSTSTSTSGTATANNKYASRFQFTGGAGMYALSMTCYLSGGASTYNAKFGIYAEADSTLDTNTPLIAQCASSQAVTASSAAAWYTLNFSAPVLLVNNNYYWMTVLVDGAMNIHRPTTGGAHGVQNNTYSSGLASPWTGAPSTGTNNYCFYITYVSMMPKKFIYRNNCINGMWGGL
jgi:hypothetical protein